MNVKKNPYHSLIERYANDEFVDVFDGRCDATLCAHIRVQFYDDASEAETYGDIHLHKFLYHFYTSIVTYRHPDPQEDAYLDDILWNAISIWFNYISDYDLMPDFIEYLQEKEDPLAAYVMCVLDESVLENIALKDMEKYLSLWDFLVKKQMIRETFIFSGMSRWQDYFSTWKSQWDLESLHVLNQMLIHAYCHNNAWVERLPNLILDASSQELQESVLFNMYPWNLLHPEPVLDYLSDQERYLSEMIQPLLGDINDYTNFPRILSEWDSVVRGQKTKISNEIPLIL